MPHPFVKALLIAVTLLASVSVAAQPRDVMLVLDNSGSMRKNDPEFLTAVAVETFIRTLEGDVRLGIIIFDENVDVAVPLSPLHVDNRARFLDSLGRVDFAGQWTDSSAALERAVYTLRTEGRAQAQRSIVFMTDGIVDTGNQARDVERTRWMQEELSAQAADAGVSIFGIAFTDNADFQLIQSLAHRTGGDYYRAFAASDIEGVFLGINARLDAATAPALEPDPPPVTLPRTRALAPAPAPAPADTVPDDVDSQPPAEAPTPLAEPPSLASVPTDDTPELEPATAGMPEPSLDAPLADLPSEVTLPPAPVSGPVTPEAGNDGDDFLAELSTPQSAPVGDLAGGADTDAAAGDNDALAGSEGAGTDAAADQGTDPVPVTQAAAAPHAGSAEVTPVMSWLLLGGGVLAVLAGGGVWLLLRRRAARQRAPSVPKAFLNDLSGATDRSSHELGDTPTVVGRMPGNETDGTCYLVIEESTIGRRHALIEYTEHAYWVADQNSLNGTFVNNERISERTRLKHGDRIRFHRREFEFVMWDMFETDRTEMSQTRFARMFDELGEDEEATQIRDKPPGRDSSATGA